MAGWGGGLRLWDPAGQETGPSPPGNQPGRKQTQGMQLGTMVGKYRQVREIAPSLWSVVKVIM